MENLDHRMPTSSLSEEHQVSARHDVKDQQRRKHKQEHSDATQQHSAQQQQGVGITAISREEKERRRRSADPSMQGENTTSAMARQQAIEERERQKKADKRRSLAEGPISSSSPLSSSPLRNSAGPGGFSQKISGGAVSRGQIVHDLHISSVDAISNNNGSANKRRSRGSTSASGRTEHDIADGSLGMSSSLLGVSSSGTSTPSSVLNATIHPLLSEV